MTTDKPTTPPNHKAPADTEAPNPTNGEAQPPASPRDPNAAKPGNTAPADDGYKVGYGCPPKATRFKKGQPSPRKGKKFNKQNHEDLFWKVMNEKVTARMGGRSVQMTRFEACVRKRTDMAMSGDNPALKEVLRLYSVMSAAKRGDEIRAVERAQRKLFYAMLDEQERQEAEPQQKGEKSTASTQQTDQKLAQEPSPSIPAVNSDAKKKWRS